MTPGSEQTAPSLGRAGDRGPSPDPGTSADSERTAPSVSPTARGCPSVTSNPAHPTAPAPAAGPAELVLRDLLDCAVGEDLAGLGSARLGGPPPELPTNVRAGRWVIVPVPGGHLAWRARDGGPLQSTRHAGGPAWLLARDAVPRTIAADEVLSMLVGAQPHADDVSADLRTAVEHARVTSAGRDRLPTEAVTPRPGEPAAALHAGERLAATRGRPFHPTARAAVGWAGADLERWGPTRERPLGLGWVLVRHDHLRLGPAPASARLHELVLGAADVPDGYQLLPVHPADHQRVLPREFADEIAAGVVVPLDEYAGSVRPTASLRTLEIEQPTAGSPVRHLKVPLGVSTLGASRLLPPRYLDNADRARRVLDAVLAGDEALAARVGLCDEDTWAGFTDGDDEFAERPGRLAAQVRTYPELGVLPVPLAALAAHEWEVLGPVLGVDGVDDAARFLADLARTVAGVGIGFVAHGVLPEMHGQNVVCCFGPGRTRVVLRDHDTVRVHPAWADLGDPGYRIAPGASQSLVLDRPEELVAYLQTLVVQVALRGVVDALARHFGVGEPRWWPILADALEEAVAGTAEPVRGVLHRTLFDAPDWPARSVLGPLLARGGSRGVSMPAGTVRVPNLVRTAHVSGHRRDGDDHRSRAERATRDALLRCHVRERGVRVTGAGPLALDEPGLVVNVTHASPGGHHRFGPDVGRRAGGPLAHDAVVAALLGDDPYGVAESVADSTARITRHLAAAPPWPPEDLERALLRGHPFHPTAKSAEGFDDADLAAYAPEQGATFRLHHLEVDPDLVVGAGNAPLDGPVLPAHPWQASYLASTPEITDLLDSGRARLLGPQGVAVAPTSSVRTVSDGRRVWKLPLRVRLTHFVRTNPHDQLRRALDASRLVGGRRRGWREANPGFGVLVETGWRGLDARVVGEERAADLAVLVREPPPPGCAVLAGLLEEGPRGEEPALMTHVRRVGAVPWLRAHLAIATIPLLRIYDGDGIGFEAHVQNVLVGCEDGRPVRFLVRDMEGVHVDRTRASGLDPASPALYDPQEAWRRVRYHQIVNQLGHLVATLGFFGDVGEDELWGVVAAELAAAGTPSASALTREETLPAKANLASRLGGIGETPEYVEIPNPIRECATP